MHISLFCNKLSLGKGEQHQYRITAKSKNEHKITSPTADLQQAYVIVYLVVSVVILSF